MSRLREKLTYANVMSTLAVFLLLGGGAYAAKQKLIDTNDIANQAVTGKKIAKSTIKSKNLKDGKGVTGADVKDGAIGDADLGSGIGGAKLADGSVSVAKLPGEEGVRILGAAGNPSLGNGGDGDCVWTDVRSEIPELNPVGFRMDRFGTVHLSGLASSEEQAGVGDEEGGSTPPEPNDGIVDGTIFVLPNEYRPENAEIRIGNTIAPVTLIVAGVNPLVVGSDVLPAGTVFMAGPTNALLDGVSFKAASSGVFPRKASGGNRERLSPGVAEALGLR